MPLIRDANGKVISRSRNLAGIRRYVASNFPRRPIKLLAIERGADDSGWLSIDFENGCTFRTNFGSFQVLRGFVQRWRNAYGAPLRVCGVDSGVLEFSNPELTKTT